MTSINNSTFLKGEEQHKQQEQEGGVVGRHTRLAGGELVGGLPQGERQVISWMWIGRQSTQMEKYGYCLLT